MKVFHFTEQPYSPAWKDHGGALRITIPNSRLDPKLAGDLYHRYYDEWQLADEIGFDIMVNEHHSTATCMASTVIVTLSILARITKKSRLLVLGYPLVHRPDPLRAAEELSTIDVISRGRLEMGFVKGVPSEFTPSNANPVGVEERFWEAHDFIIKAMTSHDGPFNWESENYHYRQVNIWPRPLQQPHPPIYMSGSSPEAGEFAAQNRLGLGFAFTTIGEAAKAAAYYREQAREAGWEPSPDDVIYRVGFHVAETDDEAFADMSRAGPRIALTASNAAITAAVAETSYYGRDEAQATRTATRTLQDRIQSGQILVGSPETIVRQIERIRSEIGAGILDCPLAAQLGEKTLRSIELFGTRVLPRIRAL
jgi:alkanesulfonate monooxygenase SsuD/methylene tetrahydromethanopterin reductase-like flavin-dependent oxidoreductase (luciferase family)